MKPARTTKLTGQPELGLTWGSTRGPVRLFDHGSEELTSTSLTPTRHIICDGALVASGKLLDGIAHLADAAGDFTLTYRGQLFLDGEHHSPVPRGIGQRRSTSLGSDGHGHLLLVAGDDYGPQRLTDTWSFDGAWHRLTPLGDPPAVIRASVALDPRRHAWLVVGGQHKDYSRSSQVSELSSNRWTTFDSRYSDSRRALDDTIHHAELLAVDEASGRVLLVRSGNRPKKKHLYTYGGSGQWNLIDTLDLPGWSSAFAWDSARRTLVAAGETSLAEFPLAGLLDALPADDAPASKATAARAKPAGSKPAATTKGTKPAAAVWLRRRKGQDDRFWFAAVDGGGWVERSGKRGEAPSEKRHPRIDTLEAAVQKRLAAGYEHAPEREEAAVIAGRTAFRFWFAPVATKGQGKRSKAAEKIVSPETIASDDTIGGLPPYVSATRWPRCPGCRQPMTHLLTLHADAERLPLANHAALAVFQCTGGDTADCASAVVLTKAGARGATRALAEVLPAQRAVYEPVFEPDPSSDESPDPCMDAKVGGHPWWIEEDRTPDCPDCREPMRFIAMLDDLHGALPSLGGEDCGFDGLVFCCETHEIGRVVMQWRD